MEGAAGRERGEGGDETGRGRARGRGRVERDEVAVDGSEDVGPPRRAAHPPASRVSRQPPAQPAQIGLEPAHDGVGSRPAPPGAGEMKRRELVQDQRLGLGATGSGAVRGGGVAGMGTWQSLMPLGVGRRGGQRGRALLSMQRSSFDSKEFSIQRCNCCEGIPREAGAGGSRKQRWARLESSSQAEAPKPRPASLNGAMQPPRPPPSAATTARSIHLMA